MKLSRKAVTVLLAAVAVLIILSGINSMRLLPLPFVSLDEPTDTVLHSDGAVIVDSNNSRILLTDEKLRVSGVIGLDLNGSPFNSVTAVAAANGRIYIAGASRILDGVYIESESVAEYSASGRLLRVLCSEQYSDDEFITDAGFFDIKAAGQDKVLVLAGREDRVEIIDVAGGEAEIVSSYPSGVRFKAGEFSETDDSFAVWEWLGSFSMFSPDGSVRVIKNDEYSEWFKDNYCIDGIENRLRMDKCVPLFSNFSLSRDSAGEPSLLLYTTDNGLFSYDFNTGENSSLSRLKLTPAVFLTNLLFFAAIAFLAILIVIKLVRVVKNGRVSDKVRTGAIILLISAGVSAFYTYRSFKLVSSEYRSGLVTQNKQISLLLNEYYPDVFERCSDIGVRAYCEDPSNRERLAGLRRDLFDFICANGKEGGYYCGIEVPNADGMYGLFYTNDQAYSGDLDYGPGVWEDTVENTPDFEIIHIKDVGYYYTACISYLRNDEGEPIALLTVGFMEKHLLTVQKQNGLNMLISLIVLEIAVYISAKAVSSLKNDVSGYKARKAANASAFKIPLFCGIASFLVTAVCQLDLVIRVYVVKELCAGLSELEAARVASIPLSLYSIGILAGSALPSLLSGRIRESVSSVFFCVLGALSMLGAVVSLNEGNVYLFSAAKLVEGVFIGGAAYSLIFSAPFYCSDRQQQKELVNSAQASAVSAAVLGILAGGYISEYISYSAVFAVKGALCVVLAVIAVLMFSGCGGMSGVREKRRTASAWGFYLKPKALLLYLCCVMPLILLSGYQSYLFPIYSQSAGLSAAMLSNIYIMARAASLVSSGSMTAANARYSPRQIMCVSLLLCSFCFVLFLLSPNIMWAVAVLFISSILIRGANTASIYCQSDLSEELGYDPKDVSLCNETVRGVFTAASTPISSLFLAFGNDWACAVLGSACFALTAVYFLVFRGERKAAPAV